MAAILDRWVDSAVLAVVIMMGTGASVAGAAQRSVGADCACVCVNGAATTLCSTIAAAQSGPQLCRAAAECPQPAGGRTMALAMPLAAPASGAQACRTVQLWDRQLEAYGPGRICDVEELQPR